MNLTGFRIFGLFGTLDHKITLKSEGVTFIHGPNGSGKTTALLLLENILLSKFSELTDVLFSSVEIDFSDRSTIVVEKGLGESPVNYNKRAKEGFLSRDAHIGDPASQIYLTLKRGNTVSKRSGPLIDSAELENRRSQILSRPSMVESLVGGVTRVGSRMWRVDATGDVLNHIDIAEHYAEKIVLEGLPSWFVERAKAIKLNVIRAQRLFEFNPADDSGDRPEVKQIVSIFSDDVREKIAKKIAQSALHFQRKEKTFPHRILAGEVTSAKEHVLRMNYVNLQKRVSTLEKVGLQESSDSLVLPETSKLNPTHKRVLTLYLSDMNEKLDVFNDIFEQISLMTELLSKKLRRKKFSIHKDDGFRLIANDGASTPLKPTDLSSGEQHQLVMLYKLIFSDEPNQLYLIDEPEISLHVEWQRQFSDDIRRISASRGHQFLIATHSPQIINGRLDLAVPLDGGIVE